MLGRGFMGHSGGVGQAAFRAAASGTAGTDSDLNTDVAKPAGVAVGDIALVFCFVTSGVSLQTQFGTVWTAHTLTGASVDAMLFWKVLNATDVANVWAITAGASPGSCMSLAYIPRGATGVAVRSEVGNPNGQSSMTLTGFSPTGYGAVVLLGDKDTDSSPAITPNFFANRVSAVAGGRIVRAWDLIDYNGGDVVLSGLAGGTPLAEDGMLVELT